MRRDLIKRLEDLEAKAKPRVISTWVDFMLLEEDYDEREVEFSPELQRVLEELACDETDDMAEDDS